MVEACMPRDAQGKFALKNGEHRSVRSVRLTDTTWSALGALAESKALRHLPRKNDPAVN